MTLRASNCARKPPLDMCRRWMDGIRLSTRPLELCNLTPTWASAQLLSRADDQSIARPQLRLAEFSGNSCVSASFDQAEVANSTFAAYTFVGIIWMASLGYIGIILRPIASVGQLATDSSSTACNSLHVHTIVCQLPPLATYLLNSLTSQHMDQHLCQRIPLPTLN